MQKYRPVTLTWSLVAIGTLLTSAANANGKPPVVQKAEVRPVACKIAGVVRSSSSTDGTAVCSVVAVHTLLNLPALSASDFGDHDEASR